MKHKMNQEHLLIPRAIAETTSSILRIAPVSKPKVMAVTTKAPANIGMSEWLNGLCARLPVALNSGAWGTNASNVTNIIKKKANNKTIRKANVCR